MKNTPRIFVTGGAMVGTPISGGLTQGINPPKIFEEYLASAGIKKGYEVTMCPHEHMDDIERGKLFDRLHSCSEKAVVVIHELSSLKETETFLVKNRDVLHGKTVILVAANDSLANSQFAGFNFAYACASAQQMPPGVYSITQSDDLSQIIDLQ